MRPNPVGVLSRSAGGTGVAPALGELVGHLVGDAPVQVRLWDGSVVSPGGAVIGTVHLRSPLALRRLLYAPNELGLGRAYVAGEIDVEGDLFAVVAALRPAGHRIRTVGPRLLAQAARACAAAGVLGGPPSPPPEEHRTPRLDRHSKARDASAIRHHYDVGNDFYALVLGEAMTYSCARFTRPDATLVEAQASKHDLICRKLGLHERPGARLLDVGCGWGSLVIHAARTYGARAVGITISPQQQARAAERAAEAGVGDLVEIRLQDYRDLGGETFDVISSVGMFEHVGSERMAEYFGVLRALLPPTGRLLNHAISSAGGSKVSHRSFVGRYVFPDGELIDIADTLAAMRDAGFEIRDVESLREHYARTLRAWVANLEANWDRAVALVGEGRARVWRLYMVGSAIGFEDNGITIFQSLGIVPGAEGASGMPRTRDGWTTTV
jgi:cyclopropane-fatty-acyl-phospholipid synthase